MPVKISLKKMNFSELIKTINTAADASHDGIEEADRLELIAACKKLQGNLENPLEKTISISTAVS